MPDISPPTCSLQIHGGLITFAMSDRYNMSVLTAQSELYLAAPSSVESIDHLDVIWLSSRVYQHLLRSIGVNTI